MLDPQPRVPSNLHPLARELLERLRGQPAARHLILGGGVALSHYLEYRETVDVDAWWPKPPEAGAVEEAMALVREAMQAIGQHHGFDFEERAWGDTRSLELRRGSRKMFSFQISTRDVQLDAPREAAWSPVRIETFRENLAAKMNALVERGAPRDFADVAALCTSDYVTPAECWALWLAKKPRGSVAEAKVAVLGKLEAIATRRPLDHIHDRAERARAEGVRRFIREVFCAREPEAS